MRRAVLFLLFSASVLSLGWAGLEFQQSLHRISETAPPPQPATTPDTTFAQARATPAKAPQRDWYPVFGVADVLKPEPIVVIVEPVAPVTAPEPEPGASYVLTGLVRSGSVQWAVITDHLKEHVVKAGDLLPTGERVIEIAPDGVLLKLGDRKGMITFPEEAGWSSGLIINQAATDVTRP